ncbi:MAG TPA: hypothetical protein VM285_16300 [Polyangia bacterium]|nr:hypothetical protein [Polyangia bacterium]
MTGGAPLTALIAAIERGLLVLDGWEQRSLRFAGWIEAVTPEDAAPAFGRILSSAFHHRTPGGKVLAESAGLALLDGHWPEEHRVHTREAAAALELAVTSAFLLAPEIPDHDERAFEVPDYGGDRPLTLGERRALASQPSRRIIARALLDPHPMVALRLLGNPQVVEADVLRIASRRPAPPSVLAELARHSRWRGRPRVAAALAHNPWTPHAHAVSLLPGLPRALVRDVSEDGRVSADLGDAARILLENRP